ncbi:RdRP-domain-containing protein [Pisolithus croceorrhizus]|nr:RdRP-domain-containing protein [Pisolithus croceorrhizus]
MNIFMTQVALAAKVDDVKVELAKILHKPPFPDNPLNFEITIFSKYNSRGRVGILALPSATVGDTFLRSYGSSGVTVKGARILFQHSTKPISPEKIAQLNSTPWQDPLELQREREKMVEDSRPYRLNQFAFGRFLPDGGFVAECTAEGDAEVACDLERRQVRFTLRKQQRHPERDDLVLMFAMTLSSDEAVSAWYPPNLVNAIVGTDSPVLFLRATTFPIFKVEKTGLLGSDTKVSRIQGLSRDKAMPPGCFSLMCTFNSREESSTFTYACHSRLRISHIPLTDITVIQSDASYCEDALDKFLSRLPFAVAFEVEKAVTNRILTIDEAMSLQDTLAELSESFPDDVASILRKFIADLEEEAPARRRRRGKRRQNSDGHSLAVRLKQAASDYIADKQRPRGRLQPSNSSPSYTFQLVLTPTRHILEGPNADQSNSVLRRFGKSENFLRVSFQDENRSKLRGDFETSIRELLAGRYRPVLVNGCRVAGRRYEFLGYSMSGLREHSMWFVTPFSDADGKLWDSDAIRGSLGDFSRLLYQPARLGARWSQAFSATDPSVVIQPHEIRKIDDRKSPSGTVMTDGCSPISTDLLRDIWKGYSRTKKYGSNYTRPCAMQFRLGGAKGMVVEDPTLVGKVVCLRPSQTKFDAPEHRTFDIQGTSLRPKAMYLNRPLIALLEFLGASSERVLELQSNAIAEAKSLRHSLGDASKVLQQHGLGASFKLPSLVHNIKTILHLDLRTENGEEYHSDLLMNSLDCAETHVLRELKYRAHIAVPGSFTLYGVSDEWNCLDEGEIYATASDERKGLRQAITGRVGITRSPQIHPGDVQIATAVRRPQLEHLTNVVVFSCKGDRPLSSCLGGGDLDGDDFNIILDPRLLPTETYPPGGYESLEIKRTSHPCGISDVVDFVFDFIESDISGQIAIAHLRFSDLKNPNCEECLQLAMHASHAVDFPKTGTPVKLVDIPRLKNKPKPDFLALEGRDLMSDQFYNSQKLLGRLYRRVPVNPWTPREWDRQYSPSQGVKIEEALRGVGLYALGLPPLQVPPPELYEEMRYLLDEYCDQLSAIGKSHTLSKNKDILVTEAEIVSGTLMATWSDQHRRREAVAAMNLQTYELVRAVRGELRARDAERALDDEEDFDDSEYEYEDEDDFYKEIRVIANHFRRACAAWFVAEEALRECPGSYGPQSFGFIALGRMLELVKAATGLL